ncbi:hypothetical protein [Treponema denticola]|uniref:hypothetical protein n=1 Tax=Treponema denticola TaxID=158 RepID=UPI00210764DA|nr:hypothetical protein [Treponema denticola]UTY24959.1 hypothetical protein E4N78_13160 [Treponema denticola]
MMTVIAIILLILNIFLILFFYFKFKNQFSDRASINNIKNETQKLVAQIAFQTDQSVTIMEDKIKEVNMLISELDKRILLSGKEEEKRSAADRVYQSLSEAAAIQPISSFDKNLMTKNENISPKNNKLNDTQDVEKEEPIKIYTKQILSSKPNAGIVSEVSFKDQIIEMAKKGLSIELIAEKVPLPTGEIELIISMNT